MPEAVSSNKLMEEKLDSTLKNAERRFVAEPNDELIFTGKLKEFTEEELEYLYYHKVTVFSSKIYYTGNPTDVHMTSQNIISESFNRSKGIKYCTAYSNNCLSLWNKYSCGNVVGKVPDLMFGKPPGEMFFVVEVAFSHESLNDAILISLNYLTDFTEINCVMYFMIGYS